MQIWPFVPRQELLESLEWRTDVIRAKAAEQRIALRPAPRQGVEFRHFLDERQFARARAMVYGVGSEQFGVPVWWEHASVASISSGATSISIDTTAADYRSGGFALIWEDDETFEQVEVDSVSDTAIALATAVQSTYRNAFVMPLRVGRSAQGMSAVRTEPGAVSAVMRFDLDERRDLGDESGLPVYRGHSVLLDCPVVGGGLNEQFLREIEVIDNETGVPVYEPLFAQSAQRFTLSWRPGTRAELWSLRQWFHARRGRQKGFWVPTRNADLELLSAVAAADTTITVRDIGYRTFYGVRDVMVTTHAGQNYYRRVNSGSAGAPGAEVLTLSAAMGVSLAVEDVKQICFLHFCRLSADRVEIRHSAGLVAAATVQCEEVVEP